MVLELLFMYTLTPTRSECVELDSLNKVFIKPQQQHISYVRLYKDNITYSGENKIKSDSNSQSDRRLIAYLIKSKYISFVLYRCSGIQL